MCQNYMVQETVPTQEIPSPTEVVQEAATSEEAAAEAPPAEEAVQPEPETPSPFATVHDPYEVLEHPEVKPLVERQMRRTEERLAAEYQQRQETETKNWEATNLFQTIAGTTGRILERLQEGDIDASEKLISRLESLTKPFEPTYQNQLRAEGVQHAG